MKKILIATLLVAGVFAAAPGITQAQELTARDLEQIKPQYVRVLGLLQARVSNLRTQLASGALNQAQITALHTDLIAMRRVFISLTALTVWASNNK